MESAVNVQAAVTYCCQTWLCNYYSQQRVSNQPFVELSANRMSSFITSSISMFGLVPTTPVNCGYYFSHLKL